MSSIDWGRDREIEEIVRLRRAAAVGRLMLGELDGPLMAICRTEYRAKPRKDLKRKLNLVRTSLKGELKKFCDQNFIDVTPEDFEELYDDIFAHNSNFRLPLLEFVNRVGQPRSVVLNGAPAHATVCLSPWGLQTEYPEMHLGRDLALAYNEAFDAEKELVSHGKVSWKTAKDPDFKRIASDALSRLKYSMRMCLLSCFNLTEAFINGVAWEFVKTSDISTLSKKQQDILTKGQASLLDKLVKVPEIVTGKRPGPLARGEEPLLTFRDVVKPFRDSIVHASPFSAPERFGGYNKLERVYELTMPTLTEAVKLTLNIIEMIHDYLGKGTGLPLWMPSRNDDGRFILEVS